MATTNRQVGRSGRVIGERLQPFHGLFVPGIGFESGHSIWLFDFDATPTGLGGYAEVWVVTPDDERILFVESEAVGREVGRYHEFDRTVIAAMDWAGTTRGEVHLAVSATDGTELRLDVALAATAATRMVGTMGRMTPPVVGRSAPGRWMANVSLNTLLGLGGLQTAGRTETGKRYRGEPVRIMLATAAMATLNGVDLGTLATPTRPVAFGDIRLTDRAVFFFGDLYMESPIRETT